MASRGYGFLIDQNLSPRNALNLHARGHVAEHVAHIGLAGVSDRELFEYAFERNLIVVTKNVRDFIDLCRDVELHPGVIAIRDGSITIVEEWQWLEPVVVHVETSNTDLVNTVVDVIGPGSFTFASIP